ncbi:MAG: DUF1223 domain-containing protein [Rhizobiaceae bacterium]|nr:DUF1223 domain-containing protein [Rhizobiaceae bacterium]
MNYRLKRKFTAAALVVFATFTLTLGSSSWADRAAAADQLKAVVELFTSQGCSSCPAADKILADYAKQKDVLALSFHVDYWNYLGWKDTFSKGEFTDRQQRYAASFRRRGVYTPQAVVNGRDHAVGSRRRDIEALIDGYADDGKSMVISVNTKRDKEKIRVTTNAESGDATLWVVYFDKQRRVKIERGENRGRTITYHNVVRDVSMLGMMKQGKIDVTLPLEEMKRRGFEACAIILQQTTAIGTPGSILGAALIDNL